MTIGVNLQLVGTLFDDAVSTAEVIQRRMLIHSTVNLKAVEATSRGLIKVTSVTIGGALAENRTGYFALLPNVATERLALLLP
jgi:hypothetical protein